MDYKQKYLKYKSKYLELKSGGNICFKLNDNLKVYELFIDKKWKFDIPFTHDVLSLSDTELLAGKIWFIKKTIRTKTYYDTKKQLLHNYSDLLPRDLCVFNPCLNRYELNDMYTYLEQLFSEYKKLNIMHSYQKDRGLTYLFTGDNQKIQYSHETLKFLKSYNFKFYELVNKILKNIATIYNIEYDELCKHVQLVPLKYEKGDGIWLHIDNVARYDQGPIMTMSIGPPTNYLDFTPTLLSHDAKLKPIRIELNEGSLVIMDGSARMEWAHGLPYNVPYEKTKYTLMFKCDKFGEQRPIKNSILNEIITTTKILCR